MIREYVDRGHDDLDVSAYFDWKFGGGGYLAGSSET